MSAQSDNWAKKNKGALMTTSEHEQRLIELERRIEAITSSLSDMANALEAEDLVGAGAALRQLTAELQPSDG